MTILQITTDFAGQVGILPRLVRLLSDDDYDTITAAGYLNGAAAMGVTILPSDFIFASYSDGYGSFNPSFNGPEITLVPTPDNGGVSGGFAVGNLVMAENVDGTIEDAGIAAEDVLTVDSDATDYQQIIGLNEILIASVGTWTRTRIAQGDYVLRHTQANDTSVIGIDITPAIREASGRGFKLASVDVIYSIATLALDAHTLTLDKVAYANNVAVAVTSVTLTGTLATATQANPYLSNIAVSTPAFDNTSNSKYVLELTVNAGATSDYDFYGLNLHFTKSVE